MELYVFSISHYSERARWALELSGRPFQVRVLTPGLHLVTMRRLRAKRTYVPLLVGGDLKIQGSDRILDWLVSEGGLEQLDAPLPERERARALEAQLDADVGHALRRLLYAPLLQHERRLVHDMWTRDAPAWHGAALWLMWPVVSRQVRAMYDCTPAGIARATDDFDRCWQQLEDRLADRPYLLGDRFTRTDLSAAALLAPLVHPREHPFRWPNPLPASVQPLYDRYAGRPLWRWVERVYADHRTSGLTDNPPRRGSA